MTGDTVISVDVMGSDLGPGPVIAGLARALRQDPSLRFLIHGDEAEIAPLVARRKTLGARARIHHAEDVITMDDRPSKAVRSGRKSSLWGALQSVADGEARVALSAGNTGAIVALSMMALRRAPGVPRPAIAVHWPSNNPSGFNVVLDMGADIRADAGDLIRYAVMGAEYARLALGVREPRIGLLNVGAEDIKGRPELHEARDALAALAEAQTAGFAFGGFIEGHDIPGARVDVVVTDGFTGNVAMKASEGTARFIRVALKDAFTHSILSRIGSLFAVTSLRRLRKRIDPRRVNGGVFLGLNGGVVKSHGSADAVGHASAVHLAAKMAANDFPGLVARQLASLDLARLSDGVEATGGAKPQ